MPKKIYNLDGLRAIAVSIVVLAHSGIEYIPGGLGVEIFFVLSGFLITAICREEIKNKKFSVKKFFIKRTFRIFPPLYVSLFIIIIINTIFKIDTNVTKEGLLAHLLFYTNYFYILSEKDLGIQGLGILWSLCVEEHYYIIFAFIALFIRDDKNLYLAIRAMVICVVIWRLAAFFLFNMPIDYFYYASEIRVLLILIGAMLATEMSLKGLNVLKTVNPISELKTIVLIIFMALTYAVRSEEFRMMWRELIHGVLFYYIFKAILSDANSKIFKPLENKWIRKIGIYSYTMYLSHAFIIKLIEKYFSINSYQLFMVTMIISIGFAYLMNIMIEKPFYRWRVQILKN